MEREGTSRRRHSTAARQAQASASWARQRRGRATVAHPSSSRSPTTSGSDRTTAASPPTKWLSILGAAPSKVMRRPRWGGQRPKAARVLH
eukprot:8044790-Alexandrium_andersonii.AAC.1